MSFFGIYARHSATYLDQDGIIIKKEKLSTDYYKPLDKLFLTGPETAAPNQPKPDSEPAGKYRRKRRRSLSGPTDTTSGKFTMDQPVPEIGI
jgi:hypothetical protein